MKKSPIRVFIFVLLFFPVISCSRGEDQSFSCDVDYVQLVDNTHARVAFDVVQDEVLRVYTVDTTYTTNKGTFRVGNDLVRIANFVQNGNQATFDFYYGENLGAFCADLFDAVPSHTHDPFHAEATRETSDKGIGKWKIKKKRKLSIQ